MGMGLANAYGAAGAAQGLQDVLAQRLEAQKLAELQRAQAVQEARQAEQLRLQRDELGFRQQEAATDREVRAAERAAAATEGARRFDIERSEQDAAAQERSFLREQALKDKSDAAALRAKEREEDRAFQAREHALDRAARSDKERLVQVDGPNGTTMWVRESDAVGKTASSPARSVTGGERQTLAYFNRAKQASDAMGARDKSGLSLEARIAAQNRAQALWGKAAPNMLQSEDQQLYTQAQRAFTEARLRKESGAGIPQGEYDNDAKTYFAQPGDSEATIKQKQQQRAAVLDGLKYASGKAYDEFYGDSGAPAAGGAEFDFDPKTGALIPRKQ